MPEYGYAGKILTIDISDGTSREIPSVDYTGPFIGGRGLASKLFWDMVPAGVASSDPENCLICAAGPVTGFTGLAGCRWVVCGKTPARQPPMFSYANLGGRFGAALKSAGYDALAVKGKSERPVCLFVH